MGEKGRRVFRNNYKGHIQKSKLGVESQEVDGDDWGGASGGGEIQQLYLKNNTIKNLKGNEVSFFNNGDNEYSVSNQMSVLHM